MGSKFVLELRAGGGKRCAGVGLGLGTFNPLLPGAPGGHGMLFGMFNKIKTPFGCR